MGGSGVSPASEWNKLGQLFYRKRELYQMAWREANLDCSLVAVARFGGPVATVHDDKKLSKLGRGVQRGLRVPAGPRGGREPERAEFTDPLRGGREPERAEERAEGRGPAGAKERGGREPARAVGIDRHSRSCCALGRAVPCCRTTYKESFSPISSLLRGPKLAEAAHELVEAAANEYDITQQRMLLRGAAYGRTFLQSTQ
ncbi:hypothetical protein CYMTET_38849 [Cymbomonas tetramitiformis]|uniref:Vps16 N-terminal domain-containing protein n=1 Tax=Cymbomonas tetramitiformis TaxID=36881 RepID=A0AAE0CB78_9CHLO|nr:hypothetical protein CYMTET_38849 [Cymbomonas tetramitiformis]